MNFSAYCLFAEEDQSNDGDKYLTLSISVSSNIKIKRFKYVCTKILSVLYQSAINDIHTIVVATLQNFMNIL